MLHHRTTPGENADTAQRDDIIEFAKMLYGADWNNQLAVELSLKPAALTELLASSTPLRPGVVKKIGAMMDAYLSQQEAKLQQTLEVTSLLEKTMNAGRPGEALGRVEWLDQLVMTSGNEPQKRRRKPTQAV